MKNIAQIRTHSWQSPPIRDYLHISGSSCLPGGRASARMVGAGANDISLDSSFHDSMVISPSQALHLKWNWVGVKVNHQIEFSVCDILLEEPCWQAGY